MSLNELPSYLRSLQSLVEGNNSQPVPGTAHAPSPSPSPSPSVPSPSPSPSLATVSPQSVVVSAPPVKKLKFLLVSTHAQQFTGYSKVSYHVIQHLAKLPWIELTHFAFQKNPQVPANYRQYPYNVDVIDAAALENPPNSQKGFGISFLPDVIRKKKPDVVLIYNDMMIVTNFLEEIRKTGLTRNFKLWVYCDQVYTMQSRMFIDILNRDADRVFAFSPFWKKCLKDQGITRPLDIILHGFDPKQFFSLPKEYVRKQIGIPNDAFVIISLNRNQPRKRYDLLIMAFAELLVKYPTKPIFLLCVCDKGEKGGWNLFELFQRELQLRNTPIEQFGNRLMVTSQDMTFRDEEINAFYNVADVGINTAEGEGWGLCNFEQMGVGVPQIVPAIGGFNEFCNKDNTVIIKPKFRYYLPASYSQVGGEAEVCDPHDICVAIEEYLNDTEKRLAHGKKAKDNVMSYTWERACSNLVKALETEKKELEENN